MNRRMRTFSALLALTALVFSFAETMAASACAPMSMMDGGKAMDAVTMTDAPRDDEVAATAAEPGAMDCPFMTERDGGEDGRHCPFGPALGQGCAGAPSLPALVLDVNAPPGDPASRVSFDEIRPDLLLARALFHPPRA